MRQEDKGPLLVKPPGAVCPMPVGRDTSISDLAESHLATVAEDLYVGEDLRFEGKTKLEAAVLSLADDASHDSDARKEFLDRIMGKPRQRVEATNLNITLSDFLGKLAEEEPRTLEAEFEEDPSEGMFS